MPETVLLLASENKHSLGAIRCTPGIQAAETKEYIYLRMKNADASILQLPAQHSYRMDEEERLFPTNGLTPVGKLPADLAWKPLTAFLPVDVPVAALPGKVGGKQKFSLIPAKTAEEGYALLTTLTHWKAWADTAPAIRLGQLQFAASAGNEVLITGKPLPALPGREFWMQDNVLLPAGYCFEWSVMPAIIAEELNAEKDSLLLFETDATWQAIPLNALVTATRSAVRLTEFVK